ncbi:MAG TPA: hypothetical protein VMW64_10255 [Dehalococcoidia bacterium]|nr:hypothetical protein [Dehalococcoidia bacterium]
MTEYRFERECRTPHSEAYLIISNNERLGRVDLHFTPSIVYATVCVMQNLTQETIDDLIDVIDEELVMSADVARDDFIVTVYQGREVGVFSDEDFEDEED